MLTRNKKKRTAGKDRSCPQNSNLKHSTVPGNHAVEVGEMVTMDRDGTSGGLDDNCQRTDYLQVAWLLREKLNDLVDSDKKESPEVGLRSLLDIATSCNIVSVDPLVLNPVLWRTLPKELLLLVFARLPLPDITRLRSLSREWRRDMATVNSGINQACHEASPTMVALLSHSSPDAFLVTIYDIKKRRWQYAYHLQLRSPWHDDGEELPHTWTAVDACDGGLVCFLSLWEPTKRNRLAIVVVNLLTRVHHELPPLHYLYFALPAMVQIKVDSHTKCYQVVVVGYRRSRLTIERYDSGTREWTRAAPPCGSIFGLVHDWDTVYSCMYRLPSTTPGAYNFAEGRLELYSDFNPSTGESVSDLVLIDTALEKDRMFALQEQTQMDASLGRMVHRGLCIAEYHLENQTKAWVQVKSYEWPPLEELIVEELSGMCLYACEGFLMVIVHHGESSQYFRLLDLSTSEWSDLPENSGMHTTEAKLCRAFWNVIP